MKRTISKTDFICSAPLLIAAFFILKIFIDAIMDRQVDSNDAICIHIWAAVLWVWTKIREEK